MKGLLFLVFFLLSFTRLCASHVVGGEIQLTKLNEDSHQYLLSLVLFFDDSHAQHPHHEYEPYFDIYSYSKSDHSVVESFRVQLTDSDHLVEYEGPECSHYPHLTIREMGYESIITLDPAKYKDAAGYYLSWYKCCRNSIIKNIDDPYNTGMVFYAEIFNLDNSLPKFKKIEKYTMVAGTETSIDFSVTDSDGDSIVYSMADPFKSKINGSRVEFGSTPGPYETVSFLPQYTYEDPLNANTFSLDPATGMLLVNPSGAGMYLLAVKAEEYRNGRKTGEVIRQTEVFVEVHREFPPEVQLFDPLETPIQEGDTVVLTDLEGVQLFNAIFKDSTAYFEQEDFRATLIVGNEYIYRNKQISLSADLPVDTLIGSVDLCQYLDTNNMVMDAKFIFKEDNCATAAEDTTNFHIKISFTNTLTVTLNGPGGEIIHPMDTLVISSLSDSCFTITISDTSEFPRSQFYDLNSDKYPFQAFSFHDFQLNQQIHSRSFPFCLSACSGNSGQIYSYVFEVYDYRCGKNLTFEQFPIYLKFEGTNMISGTVPDTNYYQRFSGEEVSFDVFGKVPQKGYYLHIGREYTNAGETLSEQSFTPTYGIDSTSSVFAWSIPCNQDSGRYLASFTVQSHYCNFITDTINVVIDVKTPELELPALSTVNLVTPNGDGLNDTYSLWEGEYVEFPHCHGTFSFSLYNRWGVRVYGTEDANFEWEPESDLPEGIYFYLISLPGQVKKKGWLHVVR